MAPFPSSGMSDFKNLRVWQKAHALAVHAYRVATKMRRSRDLALRGQIIRAAISIPANIVEGRRQDSDKEFARFLRIALNSACELEYHLILARDLEAIPDHEAESLVRESIEVRRMLHGLINRLAGHPQPKVPSAGSPIMKAPGKAAASDQPPA